MAEEATPAQESVFEAEIHEGDEVEASTPETAALAALPPVTKAHADPDYVPKGDEIDEEFLPSVDEDDLCALHQSS